MTVHPLRRLAKAILAAADSGSRVPVDRGVIVSSQTGQSVVTVKGEDITVFNYDHTASLAVGTVVDVMWNGNVGHIIGHY